MLILCRGLCTMPRRPTWQVPEATGRDPRRPRPASARTSLRHVTLSRPLGIQLLAALLTIYTMGGFLLALGVSTAREERYRWWWLIAGASVAFAVACGATTLAVWRIDRKAPWLLVACGSLGCSLFLTLPAAAPSGSVPPGMWRAAIQGAVLILAFLLLAAWYVRTVVRARA